MDIETVRLIGEGIGILLLILGGTKYRTLIDVVFALIDGIEVYSGEDKGLKQTIQRTSRVANVEKPLDELVKIAGYKHGESE